MEIMFALGFLALVGAGALVRSGLSLLNVLNYAYRTGKIDGERGNTKNDYYNHKWVRKAYTAGWVKGIRV